MGVSNCERLLALPWLGWKRDILVFKSGSSLELSLELVLGARAPGLKPGMLRTLAIEKGAAPDFCTLDLASCRLALLRIRERKPGTAALPEADSFKFLKRELLLKWLVALKPR